MLDPTKRFSTRVENYLKYRPRYPAAIIPLLEKECGLTQQNVIADLGSGTGFLTELFLEHGNQVFGIEPNAEMRSAGEKVLSNYPRFVSVEATAEATTLPDQSMDFVVAGQAFHWFDRSCAQQEFLRILKPEGWVVLIWNGYRIEASPMMAAYQQLVSRYGTDYSEVQREVVGMDVESFFTPGTCKCARFAFVQQFNYQGLEGLLLSSSYAPDRDHPDFAAMLRDLRRVFDAQERNGLVNFDYETEVYYGQFDAPRP